MSGDMALTDNAINRKRSAMIAKYQSLPDELRLSITEQMQKSGNGVREQLETFERLMNLT